MGQPLVATPDDFGIYGARPTHPDLLDHLATRFMAGGWSMKELIRNIVLTRTYGLDSNCDAHTNSKDPDNSFLRVTIGGTLDVNHSGTVFWPRRAPWIGNPAWVPMCSSSMCW